MSIPGDPVLIVVIAFPHNVSRHIAARNTSQPQQQGRPGSKILAMRLGLFQQKVRNRIDAPGDCNSECILIIILEVRLNPFDLFRRCLTPGKDLSRQLPNFGRNIVWQLEQPF